MPDWRRRNVHACVQTKAARGGGGEGRAGAHTPGLRERRGEDACLRTRVGQSRLHALQSIPARASFTKDKHMYIHKENKPTGPLFTSHIHVGAARLSMGICTYPSASAH